MKFWRTTAVVALAVAFAAASAFAGMAPKAPAAAKAKSSGPGPGPGPSEIDCFKNTETAPVFPLVMPVGRLDTTSTGVGNGFPWENSTYYFSSHRNQYLFPSQAINAVAAVSVTMDGIQIRDTSFTGTGTHQFGNFLNGDVSIVRISDAVSGTLATNFTSNILPGTTVAQLTGTDTDPIVINMETGPLGSDLSTCASCPDGDMWFTYGAVDPGTRATTHLLFDHIMSVVGGSGYVVWDTSQGMDGLQRAYGSGSFVNPNHLTTAYGVDTYDFIWVFTGVGKPPAATVEQQIKEIVRLLLTPEGLRCSGLDLNAGDGQINDDPLTFPNGAMWDPIQPQVTTGMPVTGDEVKDDLRKSGWLP